MKKAIARTVLALVACAGLTICLSAQEGDAKQDVKDAGHATAHAAKKTGHAVKKGTKKAYRGTKKGVHKAAEKTGEGMDKVEDKTADHPKL